MPQNIDEPVEPIPIPGGCNRVLRERPDPLANCVKNRFLSSEIQYELSYDRCRRTAPFTSQEFVLVRIEEVLFGRARSRTRGVPLRTYKAPTPFGPYSLWAERLNRSTSSFDRSMTTLPTVCVASEWNRTPACRYSLAMAFMGFKVPTSLFACITDTNTVSSRIASFISSVDTAPSRPTGSTVTSKPSRSRRLAGSSTDLCSAALTIKCLPLVDARITPIKARLFASVAPLVNTIDLGSQLRSDATCSRAVDTALPAARGPAKFVCYA